MINMLLKEGVVNDGDHVIYLDGDTPHFMQRILDAASDDIDFQTYRQENCEYSWTKGDVFARFGVNWGDRHYGLTGQIAANIFRLIVNSRTRNLLQTWENLMMDWRLCSDEASVNKSAQSPFFGGDHRHDQSILGMLLKASVKGVPKCTLPSKGGPLFALQEAAESGWSLHPEFGIDGLRVRYLFTDTW